MNRQDDRQSLAHALFKLRIANQTNRLRFGFMIIIGCTIAMALILPLLILDKTMIADAARYGGLSLQVWFADKHADAVMTNLSIDGVGHRVSALAYLSNPPFQEAPDAFMRWLKIGGLCGFVAGCAAVYFLVLNIRKTGEETFGDRIIGGTRIVDEAGLIAAASSEASSSALQIGRVPIPDRCETRHFAMIGTTGSGKTTVLRQMLDGIERRGEAALVYDTSGEFIAHYYRPERGDIILNPFDDRCAYWSPFDEISHPADADRIAHQLVSETGSHDDDVWLETSRILVANMLRTLWAENNRSLEALLDALQVKTKEQLKHWLGNTSSARTFADDADRATGSVLFMLAKAANLLQFLRAEGTGGDLFAFRDFIHGLDGRSGPKPWIFVPRKEDYFEAAKPLLACWLECAASAVLGLPPSPDRRIWFILDELADLPRVENLARLLPEGRKFGAAIMLTFQALGQMRHRYGPPIAESMLACCNTKLFLQTVDQETRNWASQTIGECEIEMRTASDLLSLSGENPRTTLTTTRHVRAAVLESELRLPKYEGYLLFPDGYPVARIGLTADHITARGAATQPAYVAGDPKHTLWSRTGLASPATQHDKPQGPV